VEGIPDFYKVALQDETMRRLARLHDPQEPMFLLALSRASCSHRALSFSPSTWTVGNYCYLQDLFVSQDARGSARPGPDRGGLRKSQRAGASRVYWLTHETNTQARALYDTLADRPGFIQYRHLL